MISACRHVSEPAGRLLQPASLRTNSPALPHSSHFRPEADERQIFVFILNRKTLNAARLPLLEHVCVHISPHWGEIAPVFRKKFTTNEQLGTRHSDEAEAES